MAKAMRFYDPRPQFFINGLPANGGKLFFYTVGTTTKKNTYTDDTKNTANPNPVILDSQGRPANGGSPIDIFLDGAYKVVFAPSTDTDPPANAIWTVASVTTIAQLETTVAKSSNYTVTETDRDKTFLVDASGGARTISLPAASTVGDGFTITVKKTDSSSNAVILDGNGSETIDGAATKSIAVANGVVKLICNGTAWYIQYQGINGFEVPYEDNRTNSIASPLTISATTSGTPAAGIGTGIKFQAESADETPSDFGTIAFEASDVASGTEDTFFTLFIRKAGAALARAFNFKNTGSGYYNFTGAPTAARTITFPDADMVLANIAAPIGVILPYAASSAPTGFLLCDGSAVSRTDYADLYALIGTTWGSGDGSTTFNVPDMRGRTPIGSGTGSGLTARTLAQGIGAETHTLTQSEMPEHTHDYTRSTYGSTITVGSSTGTITTGTTSTSVAGAGAAHNNMQPSRVVQFIIKAV